MNLWRTYFLSMQKASNQLNDICRLQRYITFTEKEIWSDSFVYSNLNYCLFVWHFCSVKSQRHIEKIQERALGILYDDYESDYATLINKLRKTNSGS